MKYKLILIMFLTIFLVNTALALSNGSIQAEQSIKQAEQDIIEMQLRDIPITRANESFQEAMQLYLGQKALEKTRKNVNYNLAIDRAKEVSIIRDSAFKADDELKIFLETYNSSAEKMNLSDMDEDYNEIILSFKEERFEDTPKLINDGYERLSEVQSSQTTANLYYLATSRSVKNFFINNWLWLISGTSGTILFLFIFKTTITRLKIKRKISNLGLQKTTLNKLIRDLQLSYFKTKKTPELEYRTKLKKFNEMLLDINRQLPLLKEEMVKLKESPKKIKEQEKKKERNQRILSKKLRKVKKPVIKKKKVVKKKNSIKKK